MFVRSSPASSFAFAILLTASLAAQRPLTHDDYDGWKTLRGVAVSQDGAWVAYQIEPQWGDGVLEVRQSAGDVVHRLPRGSGARFSADGRYCVYLVGKSKVEEREKKIEELRKKTKELREGKKPAEGEGGEGAAAQEPQGQAGARGGLGARGGRGGAPGLRGGGAPGAPGAGGDEANRERGDLAILDLTTGKVETVPKVKGFTLPDDLAVLVYHLDKDDPPAKPDGKQADGATAAKGTAPKSEEPKSEEPKTGEPKVEEPKVEPPKSEGPKSEEPKAEEPKPQGGGAPERGQGGRRGRRGGPGAGPGQGQGPGAAAATPADPLEKKRKEGTTLVVRDLAKGAERRIDDVVAYGLLRKNTWLWYHSSAKKPDSKKTYGLFATRLDGSETQALVEGFADFGGVTGDRKGQVLAFTCNKDDFAADKPRSDVWFWSGDGRPAERIAYPGAPGMPSGKVAGGSLSFARDGSVLAFSVQDPPEQELPPILPEEKVVLDIWHWNDGELQTQQQKRTRRDGTLTAVWHRAERRLQVVGGGHVEQVRLITPDGSRGVGSDDDRYERLTQWDGRYADVYLVNTVDGSRQKVLEKLRGSVSNSPGGRWLCWFGPDYHWWALDVATQQKRDLTGMLPVAFHNVEDDHPEPDPAYGIAGWTANDASVLLYDEYDVWQVAPATGEAVCVTDGFGRSNHLRLRVQRLPRDDDEDDLALPDDLLLAATDAETMAEGFYTDVLGRTQKPQRLVQMDKRLGELRKAKKAERFCLTIGGFDEFPDLWTGDARFGGLRKLSAANPQQKEFRWGKAELVHWVNGDGVQLKGILVKPDGFDPHRKYPMLVNFYERSAQNLHNYVAPAPGTGPNASYYVSNGYLWFMPDIVYEVGYPGESCVKCVVSGVESLIAQGFVDEHAIGAAGHSWGGYQTAFLVTRTNIFAAVESGAPVSDMISAYGGIRYESGVSRQFQYEQTQSRIGGTPWTHPMRYWENSPIFFADKVRTPVLILHNDNDGAVPWTNGIEYFTALKRLGKEAYLFDYNGEPHGLTKRQNMKDWARRMAEFFDHHLKHAPMPKWMQDGVPFSERDREKLPFTRSYIEAQAEPASAKPVEATAPRPNPAIGDATKGEPKGDTVIQEPKPAAQGQEPKPAPKPEEKPQGEAKKPDEKKPDEKKPDEKQAEPKKAGDGKAAGVAPIVITPGRPAPDFAAADEAGKVHKLADYRGRTLVLWFYAKADTPG